MSLKFEATNLDEIDESLRSYYKEVNGKFVLDGLYEAFKPMEEFKTVHTALQKERADHKAAKERVSKYGEWTPEKIEQISTEYEELKLKSDKTGDTDELFEKKVKLRTKPFETQIEAQKAEADKWKQKATETEQVLIGMKLDLEINKLCAGTIDPKSIKDVMYRAKFGVKWDNDLQEFRSTDGLTLPEWFQNEKQDSNWGLPSGGGGAKGSDGGTVLGGNPFKHGDPSFNVTTQAKMLKDNPKEAARLMELAKKK